VSGWSDLDVETSDGVVLHAVRRGRGPAIVMAHGVLDDGECWTRVAEALEADHDVVAYDARYHGRTREPDGAPWGSAADLLALVDALGLDRPVAMGHSMGAVTAAHAVAAHPGRFRAAVLEDPAWRSGPLDAGMVEAGRGALEGMLAASEPEIEALGRQFSPGWDDAEYAPWARAKARFHGMDHMSDALQVLLTERWQDTAARLTVPVLLVCGDDAGKGRIVTPDAAAEASAHCATLEVATLAGAGHNVRRDAFEAYVDAVTGFLARVA
jgi:pimeloyl-ACP methyl ester carboxylesterase